MSQHQDFAISLEKIPGIFFKLLDLDPGFLQMPVENWHESGAFIKNLTKIEGFNDSAERYITLSSDFIGSALNEEDILQVMKQQRKEQPSSYHRVRLKFRQRWEMMQSNTGVGQNNGNT